MEFTNPYPGKGKTVERYIAHCERETKRRVESSSYELALRVIDNTLAKAREYESRMTSMESASLSPEQLACDIPPALFKGQLRDYQMTGFQWLVKRCFLGESVILADAMGLGKTIQILAYLAWTKEHVDGSTLIICPLSTLGNWLLETNRFLPDVPVVRYYGTAEEKRELDKRIRKLVSAAQKYNRVKAQWTEYSENPTGPEPPPLPSVAYFPIVLASYEVAVRDANYLLRVQWKDMIMDEAHRLKNEKGITRRILSQYSQTRNTNEPLQKIMLTGTPIQNDLIELWSLCHFLLPAVFSSANEFKRVYSFVGQGTRHHTTTLLQQEQENHVISKLQELVQRYVLRRTKREVNIALPPKVELLVYCPLTPIQVKLLRAVHAKTLPETLKDMRWGHPGDDTGAIRAAGLSMTSLSMRKICVHPYFLAEPLQTRGATDDQIITTCGKMLVLDALLKKLRNKGHRVLIFSQFSTVIDILSDYLTYREREFGEYRVITGATPVDERDEAIAEFHSTYRNGRPASEFPGQETNDISVFLLSTRAGGLGINLVGADTVIFYDSDWNPSMDDQAMDRVHRIGQAKPVVVYRLVTEGAGIEKRMLHVAQTKQGLGKMSLRDEFTLFRPNPPAASPASPTGDAAESSVDHSASSLDANLFHYWVNPDSILDGTASTVTTTVAGGADNTTSADSSATNEEALISAPPGTRPPPTTFRGIEEDELEAISDRHQAVLSGLTYMAHIEHMLVQTDTEPHKDPAEDTAPPGNLLTQLQDNVRKDYQSWIPADTPFLPYRGSGYMVVYHSSTGKDEDGDDSETEHAASVGDAAPPGDGPVIDESVPDELLLGADLRHTPDSEEIASVMDGGKRTKPETSTVPHPPSKLAVAGTKRSHRTEPDSLRTPVGQDEKDTASSASAEELSDASSVADETGATVAKKSRSSGANDKGKDTVQPARMGARGKAADTKEATPKAGGGNLITSFFKRQAGSTLEAGEGDIPKKATKSAPASRKRAAKK